MNSMKSRPVIEKRLPKHKEVRSNEREMESYFTGDLDLFLLSVCREFVNDSKCRRVNYRVSF